MNLLLLHADEVQFYTWDDMFIEPTLKLYLKIFVNKEIICNFALCYRLISPATYNKLWVHTSIKAIMLGEIS